MHEFLAKCPMDRCDGILKWDLSKLQMNEVTKTICEQCNEVLYAMKTNAYGHIWMQRVLINENVFK